MFDIFHKNKNFCDAVIKPWIFLLFFFGIFVLGWAIYEKKIMEPEDFAEDLYQQFNQNAAVLTDFSTQQKTHQQPVQQQNNNTSAITGATPKSGRRLIGNNAKFYLQDTIKRTIASIRPSVVNIKASKINTNGSFSSSSVNQQVRFSSPDGSNSTPNPEDIYESVGSGIIVSTQGHILTNYHVIANSSRIVVSVYGMKRQNYIARVIDHHVDTDLTLLKLETVDEFKPADLGNSDFVEVGDLVLTFGNPFGLEQTVTSGMVGGTRKTLVINSTTYHNMIQTDAPINRGSSGGPLTNLSGEVIGINTAIYAPTGVFNGTGFAMPINRVNRFLAEHNIVPAGNFDKTNFSNSFSNSQGWLGIEVQSIDKTIALHLGLPYIGGALINRVVQNSPARMRGLERGDVILEFDGEKISSIERLENLIADLKPTDTVKMLVFREKKLKEFYITLSDMPEMTNYN